MLVLNFCDLFGEGKFLQDGSSIFCEDIGLIIGLCEDGLVLGFCEDIRPIIDFCKSQSSYRFLLRYQADNTF